MDSRTIYKFSYSLIESLIIKGNSVIESKYLVLGRHSMSTIRAAAKDISSILTDMDSILFLHNSLVYLEQNMRLGVIYRIPAIQTDYTFEFEEVNYTIAFEPKKLMLLSIFVFLQTTIKEWISFADKEKLDWQYDSKANDKELEKIYSKYEVK